ncbi:hypothetical protein [Microcoleus sp.]
MFYVQMLHPPRAGAIAIDRTRESSKKPGFFEFLRCHQQFS